LLFSVLGSLLNNRSRARNPLIISRNEKGWRVSSNKKKVQRQDKRSSLAKKRRKEILFR
jgi:hypothetical protein